MACPLATFQGDALYVDTNDLVGLVDADSTYHPACAAFFQRAVVSSQPIRLVTATLTLDEVIFVLLQEMLRRAPYAILRNRSQYLQTHPEIVRTLMRLIDPLLDDMSTLVSLEPVTVTDITQMRQEMQAHGTLPRDAIHLAVMQRCGLTAIASDDAGFDHRQDITRFHP